MTKIDHRHDNSGRFPFTEAKAGSRQKLISERLNRGLSQTEVADLIGCSQEQYSLIESNKRNGRRYWSALSDVFGISPDILMEVNDSEPDWTELLRRKPDATKNVERF